MRLDGDEFVLEATAGSAVHTMNIGPDGGPYATASDGLWRREPSGSWQVEPLGSVSAGFTDGDDLWLCGLGCTVGRRVRDGSWSFSVAEAGAELHVPTAYFERFVVEDGQLSQTTDNPIHAALGQ